MVCYLITSLGYCTLATHIIFLVTWNSPQIRKFDTVIEYITSWWQLCWEAQVTMSESSHVSSSAPNACSRSTCSSSRTLCSARVARVFSSFSFRSTKARSFSQPPCKDRVKRISQQASRNQNLVLQANNCALKTITLRLAWSYQSWTSNSGWLSQLT